MNSLVKVFSNFKEFYSEINGATLTGAIDVIVVEQPNGDFLCSPFHVRFGKLGVLRSREKVVDIEINGEPVDIHMKLGESGEAFFVEEVLEADAEELPDNLATSPIPISCFPKAFADKAFDEVPSKEATASEDIQIALPLPRRNSIDFSKEIEKEENVVKFENQVSDFAHRRYTDNTLERRNRSEKIKEYTTQKLRKEWAEHEEIFHFDVTEKDKDWSNSTQSEDKGVDVAPIKQAIITISKSEESATPTPATVPAPAAEPAIEAAAATPMAASGGGEPNGENSSTKEPPKDLKDESKGKKKRRRKSQLKKKNAQRKSSSSSSVSGTTPVEAVNPLASSNSAAAPNIDEIDTVSLSISQHTNSSNEEESSPKSSGEQASAPLVSAMGGDDSPISETGQTTPLTPNNRIPDLDIHFFSDTEITSSAGNGPLGSGRGAGRPSTPIQSDSELEISMREKDADMERISVSASWKWGELPTPEHTHTDGHSDHNGGPSAQAQAQAQRNSMLSGMFNFMRKSNKMRKQAEAGGVYLADLDAEGMDAEMASLYFPSPQLVKEPTPIRTLLSANEDDRESGNGTSLPHSPSSMEGQKSVDSDYDDGKLQEARYLDFVAMSLCGNSTKGSDPTDEEFDRHLIKYSDVCANPSLFSSPNLVVRLNGKYYNWAAACPIVMTIITFQKPLTDDAIEQLMTKAKEDSAAANAAAAAAAVANGGSSTNGAGGVVGAAVEPTRRSWWYWRRSQGSQSNANAKVDGKQQPLADGDHQTAVGTQTTRPNSPDVSDNTFSKSDSNQNAENTSAMVENLEDLSQASSKSGLDSSKHERFRKTLRLSSEAIKKLNLNDGMNEIEFSVTTAYQGTTRCKCYLFRWKHSDKVVISDIDGTITRSDVLGHILPMVGKDWAQLGVAQLFSKIEQNGYKLLYLSARAIGQSRATREYLRSIRQGDVKLPDGPLLLNPTSLISAFHREVIERKPEQFKIACLTDIRDLFPDKEPFYAGYGNRINDVWAYRAVGIPIMRIFTINTKGELKHELTQTFQSSYCSMTNIVDQLFPPINGADEVAVEYSSFNFWRDPIPEISFEAELEAAASAAAAVAAAAAATVAATTTATAATCLMPINSSGGNNATLNAGSATSTCGTAPNVGNSSANIAVGGAAGAATGGNGAGNGNGNGNDNGNTNTNGKAGSMSSISSHLTNPKALASIPEK